MRRSGNLIDLVKSFPTFLQSYFHFPVTDVLFHPCSLLLNPFFELESYSDDYFLASVGFDTAEKESLKVCEQVLSQLDRLS